MFKVCLHFPLVVVMQNYIFYILIFEMSGRPRNVLQLLLGYTIPVSW